MGILTHFLNVIETSTYLKCFLIAAVILITGCGVFESKSDPFRNTSYAKWHYDPDGRLGIYFVMYVYLLDFEHTYKNVVAHGQVFRFNDDGSKGELVDEVTSPIYYYDDEIEIFNTEIPKGQAEFWSYITYQTGLGALTYLSYESGQ